MQPFCSQTQSPRAWRAAAAFTLLEMSVVLAVIGLIAGGIFAGHDLIRAAQVRNVEKDTNNFKTAVQQFSAQYGALPGDLFNATNYWGYPNPGVITGASTALQCTQALTLESKAVCNGNSDGQIATNGNLNFNERFYAWKELSNAGYIAGNYLGCSSVAAGSTTNCAGILNTSGFLSRSTPGVDVPRSNLSAAVYIQAYMPGPIGNTDTNLFPGSYNFNVLMIWNAGPTYPLTPLEASSIDSKLDDGSPTTGIVLAAKSTGTWMPNCATSGASTALYNTNFVTPACNIMISLEDVKGTGTINPATLYSGSWGPIPSACSKTCDDGSGPGKILPRTCTGGNGRCDPSIPENPARGSDCNTMPCTCPVDPLLVGAPILDNMGLPTGNNVLPPSNNNINAGQKITAYNAAGDGQTRPCVSNLLEGGVINFDPGYDQPNPPPNSCALPLTLQGAELVAGGPGNASVVLLDTKSIKAYNTDTCDSTIISCNAGTLSGDLTYNQATPTPCSDWYVGWVASPTLAGGGPNPPHGVNGTNWFACSNTTVAFPNSKSPKCTLNLYSDCPSGTYTATSYASAYGDGVTTHQCQAYWMANGNPGGGVGTISHTLPGADPSGDSDEVIKCKTSTTAFDCFTNTTF